MKYRSIKQKFLTALLSGALLIAIAVGLCAFWMTTLLLHEKADALLQTRCEAEAAHFNDLLGDVQKSVEILAWRAQTELDSTQALSDAEYQAAYTAQMLETSTVVAQNTGGVVSYYLRYDPALTSPTAGFFITRPDEDAAFVLTKPTDLTLYPPEDTAHVGWYWQARNAGKPVWTAPYLNENTGTQMISYVIPLYAGHTFVGVVGMDVDFSFLKNEVDSVALYENGYAFLTAQDGSILYAGSPSVRHQGCMEASALLLCGMRLSLHAAYQDVVRESFPILLLSLAVFTALIILYALFIIRMTNRITAPLKRLTQAVQQLEAGAEDVAIDTEGDDEIALLARAFQDTSLSIRSRMSSMSELAYRDSLTGVKSRVAYVGAAARIDQQLTRESRFGVIVLDANGLKNVNDSLGHDVGNTFICHIARIVCDVFKHSPVFRFGGDEFVVLLEGRDLTERKALLKQLNNAFAASPFLHEEAAFPCVVASGLAVFDAETDKEFNDVFIRADKLMYQHKRRLKGQKD